MSWRRATLVSGAVLAFMSTAAIAHHSFSIFDQAHPIELVGVVAEFKFANPHTVIVLQVKGEQARSVVWQLEGQSANSLAWSGWSNRSIKPGDQLRMTIEPLRSGAPGGAWHPNNIKFIDGAPVASTAEGRIGR